MEPQSHASCSGQFAENVSPRSNWLVHGAAPSVNEPVRSVLHELSVLIVLKQK